MGENLQENIPTTSSSLDHEEATEGCESELTRTNSDSSAISLDTSKDFSSHCADARLVLLLYLLISMLRNILPGSRTIPLLLITGGIRFSALADVLKISSIWLPMRNGQSAEWTDEKHSLYLDSLEASFVNELYHSMHLGCSSSRKSSWGTYSSQELPDKTNNYGKFVVLRDGSWQNINYEREETFLETAADCHGMKESPCIHPITSLGKRHYVASSDPHEQISYNEGFHLRGKLIDFSVSEGISKHKWQEDSVGSITEVSDQNFVDEDHGAKSSCKSVGKRLKTAGDDASSSDQVVPSKKFLTADVSVVDNTSSEREEQGCHELMSEHPERSVCPKSDLPYFLRGS
ncbi:hypothetical protein FNV43_RR22495 [Rhamnella rubrinervis]|uniref:Uncharacterized protein n=1 Tax=Rhamnella rubrinervis TaxID=2594499 RepID=A0A8K0DVB9_9ROSA|nr:hypothetical protein FNV43_RR22495 [Rhamnella rubrinervis]